jgi:RimJ/RimL family protein N-acetyltransferase
LLEGKLVNLRVMEKDDVDFEVECFNDIDFWGENPFFQQMSKSESIKEFDNPSNLEILLEFKMFIVQKKDGTRIGFIWHIITQPYGTIEISCLLVPNETRKGYGTEATRLMVDYLFLSKKIIRIQTTSNARNKAARACSGILHRPALSGLKGPSMGVG